MKNECAKCGRTEVEIRTDARNLGLFDELQGGLLTCCQISQWAEQQLSAWLEAMHEDAMLIDETAGRPNGEQREGAYVYVRLRRKQR